MAFQDFLKEHFPILALQVLGTPAAELLARKFRRNVGAAKMLRLKPPFWLNDIEADY